MSGASDQQPQSQPQSQSQIHMSFDDVRQYIFETNAIEETELFLIKNLLAKSHQKDTDAAAAAANSSTSVILSNTASKQSLLAAQKQKDNRLLSGETESMSTTTQQKEAKTDINNLRISDIFESMEKPLKTPEESPSKVVTLKPVESDEALLARLKAVSHNREDAQAELDEFERIAQEELAVLERRRELVRLQVEEKRKAAEKAKIIERIDRMAKKTKEEVEVARSSITAVGEAKAANYKHLQDMAVARTQRIQQAKAQAERAERELNLLSSGQWNMQTSTLRDAGKYKENEKKVLIAKAANMPGTLTNDERKSNGGGEQLQQDEEREEEEQQQQQQDAKSPVLLARDNRKPPQIARNEEESTSAVGNVNQQRIAPQSAEDVQQQRLERWLGKRKQQLRMMMPPEESPEPSGLPPMLPPPVMGRDNGANNSYSATSLLQRNAVESLLGSPSTSQVGTTAGAGDSASVIEKRQDKERLADQLLQGNESAAEIIQRLRAENQLLRTQQRQQQQQLKEEEEQASSSLSALRRRSRQQQGLVGEDIAGEEEDPQLQRPLRSRQQLQQQQQQQQRPNNNNDEVDTEGQFVGRQHSRQQQQKFYPSSMQDQQQVWQPQQPMMQPPHMNPYSPQQQQQYNMYQQPPQQQQQNPELLQLLAMTEQLERESQQMMGQLQGGGGPMSDPFQQQYNGNNNNNNNYRIMMSPGRQPIYGLERDRRKNMPHSTAGDSNDHDPSAVLGLTKEELRRREELSAISHDLEKLKKMDELEEYRTRTKAAALARSKELEYNAWFEEQRRQLQQVKMAQVLAKEKQLLDLQTGGSDGGGGGDFPNNTLNGSASMGTLVSGITRRLAQWRAESAVSDHRGAVCSLPLKDNNDHCVAIYVDGLLLAAATTTAATATGVGRGASFRIALGLYDAQGAAKGRLQASNWQRWDKDADSAAAINNGPAALFVQCLQIPVRRIITDPSILWDAGSSNGRVTVLCEVQVKDDPPPDNPSQPCPQRSLGWSSMSIARNADGSLITSNSQQLQGDIRNIGGAGGGFGFAGANNGFEDPAVLAHNAWRMTLKSGLADPSQDPAEVPPPAATPFLVGPEAAWLLMRVCPCERPGAGGAGGVMLRRSEEWSLKSTSGIPLRIPQVITAVTLAFASTVAMKNEQAAQRSDVAAVMQAVGQCGLLMYYSDANKGMRSLSDVDKAVTEATTNAGMMMMSTSSSQESAIGFPSARASTVPPSSPLVGPSIRSAPDFPQLPGSSRPASAVTPTAAAAAASESVGRQAIASPSSSSSRPASADSKPSLGFGPSLSSRHSGMVSALNDKPGGALPTLSEEGDEKDDDSSPRAKMGMSMKAASAKSAKQTAIQSKYWSPGTPTGAVVEKMKYEPGDGIDVYIDGAMNMPDNCTVTRVYARVFAATKEMVGDALEAFSLPNSSVRNPSFFSATSGGSGSGVGGNSSVRIEVRPPNSSADGMLPSTCTLLARIDTLDGSSLLPVSVGYFTLKLLATAGSGGATQLRIQPTPENSNTESGSKVYVNNGAFQLPIYGGRLSATSRLFNEDMLEDQGLPRVPCASVLVRVVPAPKSADGVTTLSRAEVSPDHWQRLGLDVPAPSYGSGAYDGSLCKPTAMEMHCFAAREEVSGEAAAADSAGQVAAGSSATAGTFGVGGVVGSSRVTGGGGSSGLAIVIGTSVETALAATMASATHGPLLQLKNQFPRKPDGGSESNTAVKEWLRSLLPPANGGMRRLLDYSLAVPYSSDIGISVNLECLFHMPEGGLFTANNSLYKVIASVAPPALFYKDPPLFDAVYYSQSTEADATEAARAQRFPPGTASWKFKPQELHQNVFLLLDIRSVSIGPPLKGSKASKGGDTNTSASSSSSTYDEAVITVEPPGPRKSYWTMLPLARERVHGGGYSYVQSGIFQLPLIEGAVPSSGLFSAANPYREMAERLASKNKVKGYPLKLSESGASILVKVHNSLVGDLVLPELRLPATAATPAEAAAAAANSNFVLQTMYLESMLTAAANGLTAGAAREDKFEFDPSKYPATDKGGVPAAKTIGAHLPKGVNVANLMAAVNKAFETSTGVRGSKR